MWWRQTAAGIDVLARPDDPPDGRWQRGSAVDALYFADSEETAWAEWYRYLAEAGLPPDQALPRDLWRWEVSIQEAADLRDENSLSRVGLRVPRPNRTDWPQFQDVGEALFAEGWPALIAPSAARPEGQVLCVFRPGGDVRGAQPIPPPQTFDRAPSVPPGLRT